MLKVNQIVSTDGSGLWSNTAKQVRILGLSVPYISDEQDFGELRVHFDVAYWDVNEDGLIYTDRQFERELQNLLTSMSLAGDDVSYSEQGMQGDDYVSLDVGEEFIASWLEHETASNLLAD